MRRFSKSPMAALCFTAVAAVATSVLACGPQVDLAASSEDSALWSGIKHTPTEGFYAVSRFLAESDTPHDCDIFGGGAEPVTGLEKIDLVDGGFNVTSWHISDVYGPTPLSSYPCTFRSPAKRGFTCEYFEQVVDFRLWGTDALMTISPGIVAGTWKSDTSYLWQQRSQLVDCEGEDCAMMMLLIFCGGRAKRSSW